MWSLDFIRRKNHDKQGARGKKWRFFHNFATFVRERLQSLKASLGTSAKFEDHRQTRLATAIIPRLVVAQSNGRKNTLDRIGGADVHPMLRWKIVKGQ